MENESNIQRVMQVCFDGKSPSKQSSKMPLSQRPPNQGLGPKSSQKSGENDRQFSPSSDTISRLKKRSQDRTQQLEQKLHQSDAQPIQRQPSQLLKSAGAYRNLRKSLAKGESQGANKSVLVGKEMNDSTVLHGSPDKSFFSTLQRKSDSRSRKVSYNRDGSPNSPGDQSRSFTGNPTSSRRMSKGGPSSLAQMMQRISRSRSKSKTAPGKSQGAVSSHIKEMEDNISAAVAQKQSALQKNLVAFKEKMAKQRQEKEASLLDVSAQNLQRTVAYSRQDGSPYQLSASPNPRRSQQSRNPKQVNFSPPSFKKEQLGASGTSFGGQNPAGLMQNGNLNESSIMAPSPEREYLDDQTPFRTSFDTSMHQVTHMMQIPVSDPHLGSDQKLAQVHHYVNGILNMVTDSLQHAPTFEDLRHKLTGALQRLYTLDDEMSQGEQLVNIFRNLAADIAYKLETFLSESQLSGMSEPRAQMVKNILDQLVFQLTRYEFVDSLPEIAKTLHGLRVSLGVQKLQSLHNEKQNNGSFMFFNLIKNKRTNRKRQVEVMGKALRLYVEKQEGLSLRQFFAQWKCKVDRQQKKQIKHILGLVSKFGENVIRQAPQANYNSFKGLPIFQEVVLDLVLQVLGFTQENQVLVEILFVNKEQTKACSFSLGQDDGGLDPMSYTQNTFDLQELRSVLRQTVRDYFIAGKSLDINDVTNMQVHSKFNPEIDLPQQLAQVYRNQPLNQLICPILSESMNHVQIVVRMTSAKAHLVSSRMVKHVQMAIAEIQLPILKGLGQFKKLSKQFSKYQESLAANADRSFVSDQLLGQLQHLNQASLDLACSQSVSQVFEVVRMASLGLLSQYEKVSIVQFDQENIYRLEDNTHQYEQFLNQMTDPTNNRPREIRELPPLVQYLEIQNVALREKMREMGQLCLEEACPLWIQILLELPDMLQINGKTIKDIVLIPINQVPRHNSTELSSIVLDNNSQDNDNATSFAFDSATNRSAFLSQSLHNEIYILKLERRLQSVDEQAPLDKQVNVEQMLRALRQLIQIAVQKIKLHLSQEKEQQRKANAAVCAHIVQKYDQITSARVKDRVFSQWIHKLEIQKRQFNKKKQPAPDPNSDSLTNELVINASIDSEEFIEGPLHQRTILRKFEKVFLRNNLKVQFDALVTKLLGNRSGRSMLGQAGEVGQLQRIVLARFLVPKILRCKRQAFTKYRQHVAFRRELSLKLFIVLGNQARRDIKASFQRWRERVWAQHKYESSQNFQMLQEAKQTNSLDGLVTMIGSRSTDLFEPPLDADGQQQPLYRTAEECLDSASFMGLMKEVFAYLCENSGSFPYSERDFKITDMVLNFQLPTNSNCSHQNQGMALAQVVIRSIHDSEQSQLSSARSDPAQKIGSDYQDHEVENFNRTFQSIDQVIHQANQNAMNSFNSMEADETREITATHRQFLRITDLESDNLLKVVFQTQQGFCLTSIENDYSLDDSLKSREVIVTKDCSKHLIVVPLNGLESVAGSLELYVQPVNVQEDCQLLNQTGSQYWIETFQKFGMAIGIGLKPLLVQMHSKLSLSQALIQNELSYEMQALMPLTATAHGSQNSEKTTFSQQVYDLDLMVRKAYRADSSRIIFLPFPGQSVGLFMHGPFNFREICTVDISNSLASMLLENPSCKSITLPSSLLYSNPFKAQEEIEEQSSVTGEPFEAIKYLLITFERGRTMAVIELGWLSLSQAQHVHENTSYLSKKDAKMVGLVSDSLRQVYFKLRLLTSAIKQKNAYEILVQRRQALFNRWKRFTFMPQIGFTGKENFNSTQYSHGGMSNLSEDLLKSQGAYGMSSVTKSVRANLAPFKSQLLEQKNVKQSILNQKSAEQTLGASKLLKVKLEKQAERESLKKAFAFWRKRLEAQRMAESAFEQVVECHQRHSEQRYSTACRLLGRLDRQACHKVGLENIILQAIDSMQKQSSESVSQNSRSESKR